MTSGSRSAAALAAALLFVGRALSACDATTGDEPDPVDGLFEPCTSDGTANDLCLPGLVCVEASAGAGGRCEATPSSCTADNDAFCGCDLDELCDNGTVPSCYVLEGRRGVICG